MTIQVSLIGGRSGDARWLSSLGAASGFDFVVSEELFGEDPACEEGPEALVLQAGTSPDVTRDALRAIHVEPYFRRALAILSLSAQQLARGGVAQLGFDDFVVRPHYEAEVLERIRIHRRRAAGAGKQTRLAFPGFVVDLNGHSVHAGGRSVPLTVREFALLAHLVARPGRVLSREDILREVWDPAYEGSPRTVDIHVRRLRKKLGTALPLETLRGLGYKLAASPQLPGASERRDGFSLAV